MSTITRLRNGFQRAFSLSSAETGSVNGSAPRGSTADQIRHLAASIETRFDDLNSQLDRVSTPPELLAQLAQVHQAFEQLREDRRRLEEIMKANIARSSVSSNEHTDLLRSVRDTVIHNQEHLTNLKRIVAEDHAVIADMGQQLSTLRESQARATEQVNAFVERLTKHSESLERNVCDLQDSLRRLRWWATGAFVTCGAIALGAICTLLIVLS